MAVLFTVAECVFPFLFSSASRVEDLTIALQLEVRGLVGVGGVIWPAVGDKPFGLEIRLCFLLSTFPSTGTEEPGGVLVLMRGNSSVLLALDTVLVGLGSLPMDIGSNRATCTLPMACKSGLVRSEVLGGETDVDVEPFWLL